MVLDLQVVNEDAVLNNFIKIGAQRFLPGVAMTMVVRLIQPDKNLRFVPSGSATTSITLSKSDASTVVKAGTFLDAGDRSLIVFSFDASDMTNMIGQNLTVTVTDGATISTGFLKSGLQSASSGC